MTRQEFINALGAKLCEELPPAEVSSQIQYYQGYLDGEIARGRSEEEAVEALGDPHLIAKTIIESPRQETLFGGGQSQADAYFEGAYQAENESDSAREESNGGEPNFARDAARGESDRGESVHDESVRGTVETGKYSFLRDGNGELNWPLFAGILAAVMIIVAFIWLVTKVVTIFGPVLLILLAIFLVVQTIRGGWRR